MLQKSGQLRSYVTSTNESENISSPAGKMERTKMLYQPRLSTYPEVVSNKITCQSKYWPEFGEMIKEDLTIYYAIGQLTDRLTFGACADDLVKYQGIQLFYQCTSPSTMIELTVAIMNPDEFSKDFLKLIPASVSCPKFFFNLRI